MDTILTYINYRKDIPFKVSPFNELDAAALSLLSGLDYDNVISKRVSLSELSENYKKLRTFADTKDDMLETKENMLEAMGSSIRYGSMLVDSYVKNIDNVAEKTFYAMTFYTSRFNAYVVYRSTSGFYTSWKENFHTLYEHPTAGQSDALSYLANLKRVPFMKINLIGHSKGGNLAVYAAMYASPSLQKKIGTIYSFDSPGFMIDISQTSEYRAISNKIKAFIPESSLIGKLLRPPYDYQIVNAIGNGVYQHDLFNWGVCPASFEFVPETNEYSISLSNKVNAWIDSIPIEDRKRVVDELFGLFKNNNIGHISDLMHLDVKTTVKIALGATTLSHENKQLLGIILKELKAAH